MNMSLKTRRILKDIVKNKFLIATHGSFSDGFKSAIELITGGSFDIEYVSMYLDNEIDYPSYIEKTLSLYKNDNLVVLTDLPGGSVNRFFMTLLKDYHFHLISGINLGLVLELIYTPDILNSKKINELLKGENIKALYCNNLIDND